MAFHDILPLGDLGDGGSVSLDLLQLIEVGGERGLDEDVDLILRLEAGGHLLVDNFFGDKGGGCIRIRGEVFLGRFNGKG